MKPATAFLKWTVIGVFVASVLVVAQISELESVAGLLQVGEQSALRPLIEDQLGEIPLSAGGGHDGQIFYAIGLDLLGNDAPDLLDHGAYRYRRILFPLLASAGGVIDGYALVYSMALVGVVSFGLAAGAVAAVAVSFGRSDWWALAIVLNPGMWLSVRLLTSDATAMAATTLALYGIVVGWRYRAVLFSLSGLAKDAYLVTPAGLQVPRQTRQWALLVVPLTILAAWAAFLTFAMGEGFTGRGNFSWPFQGMIQASSNWGSLDGGDLFYLSFAIASVLAGVLYGVFRRGWLKYPILLWSLLALVSSNWVWDLGNNAARAFAPISILVAISHVANEGRTHYGRNGSQRSETPEMGQER